MIACEPLTSYRTTTTPLTVERPQLPRTRRMARPSVLIVDDEASLRDVLRRGLEREGFGVYVAANGWQALDIYQQYWEDIAVVVLDISMRGLDGVQTLKCMAHINPKIRACFMTGGMINYAQTQLLEAGAMRVLCKPFPMHSIAAVVRQIIDETDLAACST